MTTTRAAVLIGVNKAGKLPKLMDAVAGAKRMAKWAKAQKFDTCVVITDEDDPVDIKSIKNAIRDIIDDGPPDQLIVYFAGHGVNNGYAEYWLLSDAPADLNEAVNVNGSAEVAHAGKIPHVVFISDACRTAADGIQAQKVQGSIIFPSNPFPGLDRHVDRFWACLLGDPANEVRDPAISASEYRAIYTEVLLDALSGREPEVIEPAGGYVRPRPLKAFLHDEMPSRVAAFTLKTKLIQEPDARITSDDDAWVSMIADGGPVATRGTGRDFIGLGATTPAPEQATRDLLRAAAFGNENLYQDQKTGLAATGRVRERKLVDAVERGLADFIGPERFETRCGIKLRGARIVDALATHGNPQRLSPETVRMENVPAPGANVLVTFEGGHGTIVPVLPNFIAALTVEDGVLVDIAYEPSANSGRWPQYEQQARELRKLRAIAAASTKSGVFRLNTDDNHAVARGMRYAEGIDPTFALYAAYAYLDLDRRMRIREMRDFMRNDLGTLLFDIAMLTGDLDRRSVSGPEVFPIFPLLAQGWALLDAHDITIPERGALQGTLLPSVWTLFNADGVLALRQLMMSGRIW